MYKNLGNGRTSQQFIWVGWLLFAGLVGLILLLTRYPVYAQTANPTPTPVYIPGLVSDSITNPYQRQISPSSLVIGQDVTAEIHLTGNSNAACLGIPGKPVDVMLVYDISASAGIGPGSNWETTSLFTQSLLDHLARPIYQTPTGVAEISRIGLISSRIDTLGVEPVLIQALTEDFTLLRNQVNAISPGDDTNMAAGLQLASEELAKVQTPDREQAVVLMLHDNAGFLEMETAVTQLRAQGIPIYLIINSLNIPAESQLDRATAEELTDGDKVFIDPTPEELQKLFISATAGNVDTAAAAIQVIEEFMPASSAQIISTSGIVGRIEGARVVWDIAQLDFGDVLDLEYGFRLIGGEAAGIYGGMVWLDCNGYPHSTVTGLPVGLAAVVDITTTPETISAQPETEQPPSESNPSGTSTPDAGSIPISGDGGNIPDAEVPAGGLLGSFPWWWLLLIPILLLLVWLLWRWWQGRKPKPKVVVRPAPSLRPPSKESFKPIKLATGEDLAHGWINESFVDKNGRSLTLRYQSSLDEQNRTQMIAQVADDKQTIGNGRLYLYKVITQDKRTGQETEAVHARMQEWNLQNPRDYLKGIGEQLLTRLEQWAKEQQAAELVIPADLMGNVNLLPAQGYKTRGTEWVKPLVVEE